MSVFLRVGFFCPSSQPAGPRRRAPGGKVVRWRRVRALARPQNGLHLGQRDDGPRRQHAQRAEEALQGLSQAMSVFAGFGAGQEKGGPDHVEGGVSLRWSNYAGQFRALI